MRTLYACEAENSSELSFEPNEIIHNGKWSLKIFIGIIFTSIL